MTTSFSAASVLHFSQPVVAGSFAKMEKVPTRLSSLTRKVGSSLKSPKKTWTLKEPPRACFSTRRLAKYLYGVSG